MHIRTTTPYATPAPAAGAHRSAGAPLVWLPGETGVPAGHGRDTFDRMSMPESEQHLSLALEAAVARFGNMVRQVGRRYRLDESGLDEVMQEVRIRLWRARGTSEQVGETNTSYVYRTASSAALDVLRRRRARQAERHDRIDGDDAVATLTASNPDPHAALEGSELADRVARAIDEIPASRRPAVRMHLAGYPRQEIATLMGWTEAKTRNLLYRGLADLRERLTAEGIGWNPAGETT
jgi:RNA polymerase sigma factor (sigma-70 family)